MDMPAAFRDVRFSDMPRRPDDFRSSGQKQTSRRRADTSGFDNGHRKRKLEIAGSVTGTICFAAYVRNRTYRHWLSKRSTEPDFNRHPEKTDRY
jgi:hypothetical protein